MQPVALLLQTAGLSDCDGEIEVRSTTLGGPNVTTGGAIAPPPVVLAESTLPFPDDRAVALLTEGADTGIAGAAVKDAIAVHIELPHAGGGIERSNLGCARAIPVCGDWQVPSFSEGACATINCATIKGPVAVAVELPHAGGGIERSDFGCSTARPVPNHWKVGRGAEGAKLCVGIALV